MRAVEQVNHVLGRIGYDTAAASSWWNDEGRPELGGRTALAAWEDGDYDDVISLVERTASQRLADALAERPDTAQRLLDSSS